MKKMDLEPRRHIEFEKASFFVRQGTILLRLSSEQKRLLPRFFVYDSGKKAFLWLSLSKERESSEIPLAEV
jgi:hypothetical protein